MKMDVFHNLSDDDEEFLQFVEWERRPYIVKERIDHFDEMDDHDFFVRFRLQKETVLSILELIEHELEFTTDRNKAIRPIDQLLLSLRFYATGSMLLSVADFMNISKSSASKIVKRVSRAIAGLTGRFIKMPSNANEISLTQMRFFEKARLPRIIGAIDCTHIKIQPPGGQNAEVFRNRKGFFSINVQTVASADLKICDIVARWPGSAHDQTIYDNSSIRRRLENNEFGINAILVADSGYANTMHMITPLLNTQNAIEELYNESVIRTRNPVERQYGVWKRRFPVLSQGLRLKMNTTLAVIAATAVLHNIAINNREEQPPIDLNLNLIDFDENFNIEPLEDRENEGNARDQLLLDYFPGLL